jgi:hypothetical protein
MPRRREIAQPPLEELALDRVGHQRERTRVRGARR